MAGLTMALAERLAAMTPASVGETALEAARQGLADTLGCAIAGSVERESRRCRQILGGGETPSGGTVWGDGRRWPPALAAMANAAAGHVLEYDDVSPVMLAHPGIGLAPALLALAEANAITDGRLLLTAYVAGYEAGDCLARLLMPEHVRRGWLALGTLGPLMAAAAGGRLLALPAERLAVALALAADSAGGLRANVGSDAKILRAGQAAAAGVWAVQAAAAGAGANPAALEGPDGFLALFASHTGVALPAAEPQPALVRRPPLVKRHCCCAAAHPAVDAACQLREEGVTTGDITTVTVTVHPAVVRALPQRETRTAAQARFNLPWCVARALTHGVLSPAAFRPAALADPVVQDLAARVEIRSRPCTITAGDLARGRVPAQVTVTFRDRRSVTRTVTAARGTPETPLSAAERQAKFHACTTPLLGADSADELYQALADLPRPGGLAALLRLLARRPAGNTNPNPRIAEP